MSLAAIVRSPPLVRTDDAERSPRCPSTRSASAPEQDVDLLVGEQAPQRVGDVGILAGEELRAVLDDGDAAAEAPVGLRELEADVAAAEDDQVLGQAVELEQLDVRQRRRGEARESAGSSGRVPRLRKTRSPLSSARAAVVQRHFDRLRRDEARLRP